MTTTWQPVKIGGGGYITGIDISSDGLTRVLRTDTFGAYIWNESEGIWDLLVAYDRLPSDTRGPTFQGYGVYAIAVAPTNSAIIYMAWRGYVFKSTDRGVTWTKTAKAQRNDMSPNGESPSAFGSRLVNRKLAVDPANADVVYCSSDTGGVFETDDGGANWAQVSTGSIPVSTDGFGHTICFDATSGTTGGKTNRIVINSTGNGIYETTDAGSSWANIAAASGPTHGEVINAKMAIDGVYYCCENAYLNGGVPTKLWRYQTGSWTNISPSAGHNHWVIACDPANAARVVVTREGGGLNISTNRGTAWSVTDGTHTRTGSDAPWLDWTNEDFMSEADIVFDPVVSGRMWFAMGIGPCYTDNITHTGTEWTFVANGIEQLVANRVICPDVAGAKPILAAWDRPIFRIDDPDVFPEEHEPNNIPAIAHCSGIDWASSDPSFIAAVIVWSDGSQHDCYSEDGGVTWTDFANIVPDTNNGAVAGYQGEITASTPLNLIRTFSNKGDLWYTLDGAATPWVRPTITGIPVGDGSLEPGWNWAFWFKRNIVCADRVTPNKFYAYNYGPSTDATKAGIYVTTDGGPTWTRVRTTAFPFSGSHAKFEAIPGHAGHLFFTSGQDTAGLYHSQGGGADGTWVTLLDGEVFCFGFGKEAPGNDYPTVFIVGYVDSEYGIWRSTSAAADFAAGTPTWTKIGDFPYNWHDRPMVIDGDKNTYGTVYIGYAGSSMAYGAEPAAGTRTIRLRGV
jgi:photosystem II stability/assembly factor-like uncharacterized protein